MKPLRIGVNVQQLTSPFTGIGHYIFCLLKRLVVEHPEVEWFLYSGRPMITPFFNDLKQVTLVNHYPGTMSVWQKIVYNAYVVPFGMKKRLEKDQIDIFWSPTHLSCLRAPQQMKRLVTIHDLVYLKAPQTMRIPNLIKEWLFFPLALHTANTVFVNSNTTGQDLINHFSLKKNPIVVYPGYEKPLHQNTHTKPFVPGKYILCLCTKEPRKNLDILLTAYQRLPETLQNQYKLVFCGGEGWKSERFTQRLDEASHSNRVINFNYVDDETRDNLYTYAAAFAFPALYEGFGMPVLEAMSYGLPLVISDIPIMHEVADDAALYANPLDENDFCQKLKQLLSDEHLQSTLKQQSNARYTQMSTWDQSADKVWEAIKQYIS